jgi:hypothetical protein
MMIERFFANDSKNRTLFDIISAQFSLHYGFKDEDTFTNVKTNINNNLREDGYLLITTFDAVKVRQFLEGKKNHIQEYTDDEGNVKTLFELVKKYEDVPEDVVMGTGNTIDVFMSWFMNDGTYQTEYLVDSRYLIDQMDKYCNLELVTTDTFDNQYELHKDFLTKYAKYEADERTRNNFFKIKAYYDDTNINKGCKFYTDLERYYVFRKRKSVKKQEGGFSDSNKYFIPSMEGYNTNYSFMNSIHHVLRKHEIIPNRITPNSFYNDMDLNLQKDIDLDDTDIKNIIKNIIVKHIDNNNNEIKILDGINIMIIERDCNNEFDIDIIKKNKKLKSDDNIIIIMKEGEWYVPIYEIDDKTKIKNGLFNMKDKIIKDNIDE